MLATFSFVLVMVRPPPIVVVPSHSRGEPVRSVEEIAVHLAAGNDVLWEGSLRVAPNQAASYQQTRTQAVPAHCPLESPYERSERDHININIHSQRHGQWPNLYRIDLSWARPAERGACGASGTRTIQVNQTVTLEPGRSVHIAADAGVVLRLSRP